MEYLIFLIGVFIVGYEVGFKKGRVDLSDYLTKETLKRAYPKECRQCPKLQQHLKKLDLSQKTIPI